MFFKVFIIFTGLETASARSENFCEKKKSVFVHLRLVAVSDEVSKHF